MFAMGDRSGVAVRPKRQETRGATALRRLRERARSWTADDDRAYYLAIARQVAEQRERRQLSQRELAELCGTTQSAIARIERGNRPPRIDTLLRISNALDCELLVRMRPRTNTKRGNG
jgi:ribosome-binding protein aMBF1 (putative translation factor)